MPTCKIIEEWVSTENWKLGETVDISDPWLLIKEGKVILLDEEGKEISPPGTIMKCPICIFEGNEPFSFARHILTHENKNEVKKEKIEVSQKTQDRVAEIVKEMETPSEKIKEFKFMTDEEKKAWRIENLRKAREARKTKVI